jgi:hypothetical protein
MNGKKIIPFLIPIFISLSISDAQQPLPQQDQAEEILYRDDPEMLPGDELEEVQEALSRGWDLNSATLEELTASGIFTAFQAQVLIDYREKYGRLWSVHELKTLPGFRNFALESFNALLSIQPEDIATGRQVNNGMLMIDAGRAFPLAAGYRDTGQNEGSPPYPGSPWKSSLRFRTGTGKKLSMALSYEKDNGETWVDEGRPEFLSGYIQFRGKGALREIVAGNYRLKQGLGLVNGSGFMHSPDLFNVNRSTLARIQPSSSLSSFGTCNGLSTRIETGHLRILSWTSYHEFDLSATGIERLEDPFESRLETGLHRTSSEREGRALGYRFHAGLQFLSWHKDLTFGILAAAGQTGLTGPGREIAGISTSAHYFKIGSVHLLWQKRTMEAFGEIAFREPGQPAFLGGFRYYFSDFLQGIMLLHCYSPGYRGIDPSAYGSGSKVENEQGMTVSLFAEPGRFLSARFTFEQFLYPAPRYLTEVPSYGSRICLTLQGPGRGNLQWKIRLVGLTRQTTPVREDLNNRPLVTRNRVRAEFRLDHQPSMTFSWQSRLLISGQDVMGFTALQQFRLTGKKSGLTLQFVTFQADEWDNRFYLYEPGPFYSFSFPVLYGRGQKMTGVVYWKPFGRMTFTCKLSRLTWYDRDHTGSGNDLIDGNRKYQLHCQVRLSF